MFKLYAITLLFCFFSLPSFCQVDFETNYTIATFDAKETNKPLFIYCYSDWHKGSKEMIHKVFAAPELAKYLNNNFVNLKLEFDDLDQLKKLKIKEPISFAPTLLFLGKKGAILQRLERKNHRGIDILHLDAGSLKQVAEKVLLQYFKF